MRKPSSAMILSVLLVVSWLGFFASRPRAAQEQPHVQWSYQRVDGEQQLSSMGKEGWEAYAVTMPDRHGFVTYFLKKPEGSPAAGRFVDPRPGQ